MSVNTKSLQLITSGFKDNLHNLRLDPVWYEDGQLGFEAMVGDVKTFFVANYNSGQVIVGEQRDKVSYQRAIGHRVNPVDSLCGKYTVELSKGNLFLVSHDKTSVSRLLTQDGHIVDYVYSPAFPDLEGVKQTV